MSGETFSPDEVDVKALTEMLDLLEHFPSNEQRARYLLTSNWFTGEGVDVAIRARVNAAKFWRRIEATR